MRAFKFSSLRKYRFKPNTGMIYLGVSPLLRKPVGINTARHCVVIGGAGGGKSTCVLVQNIRKAPQGHATLNVDVKGELVRDTYKEREALGHQVIALSPAGKPDNVPERLLGGYNPLDELDVHSSTLNVDIRVISEAMVISHNKDHAFFDQGGKAIINGIILYVLTQYDPEERNLVEVRKIIRDKINFKNVIDRMQVLPDETGLFAAALNFYETGSNNSMLGTAQAATEWLDDPGTQEVLSYSSFSMADLKKEGKGIDIFLCTSIKYLTELSRFLRIIINQGIRAMLGEENKKRCLFTIDECQNLDQLPFMSQVGLLRSMGIILMPVFQDLGQAEEIYNKNILESIFGNSDASIFFNISDQKTLEYVSTMMGTKYGTKLLEPVKDEQNIGKPNMSPLEIKAHTMKDPKTDLARRAIVFAPGDNILSIRLHPFFKD